MKIKSILKTVLIIIACLIMVIGFYVYNISNNINQAVQKNSIADSLVEEIFKMNMLVNEYTVHHKERQKEQLQVIHNSIVDLLAEPSQKFNDPQEKEIIDKIKAKHLKIDKIITRMYTNHEDVIHYNDLLEERLLSHLQIYSQYIFTDIFRMKEITSNRVETAKTRIEILTIGTIVLFVILIFASILFVHKNILKPVAKLSRGTKIIGQGNFDFQIENNVDNEIGFLAQAFNDMTKKLQKTTVSNKSLKQEVKKRKRVEHKLIDEKTRLENILQTTQDGYWMVNLKGEIIDVNQAYIDMTGYSRRELLGMSIAKIEVIENEIEITNHIEKAKSKEYELFETKHKTKDGGIIDVEVSTSYVKMDSPFFVVFIRNITERKKEEKQIKYLSFHDKMTGLYNRRYFENEMERLNKSRKLPISIIVADIDGLKKINDNYGHKKGDEYIKKAAKILTMVTRKEDIVARIGGDEFVVLLTSTDKKTVRKICKRIKKGCDKINEKLEMLISISVGWATKKEEDEEIEDLFQEADALMYKNKNMSKNS